MGGELVREGMSVVEAVSRRIARRMGSTVDVDELRGIGNMALLRITASYDPTRAAFATYAAFKLKWAMFDEVRKTTHGRSAAARLSAVMASERICDAAIFAAEDDDVDDGARLASFLEDQAAALALGLSTAPGDVMNVADDAGTPEEVTERAQLCHVLRQSMGALDERERALVERHYYGGEPFEAIAEELGISKSWASRIHRQAIDKLGRLLREES